MTPENTAKVKRAADLLDEASRLLDSVISSEWKQLQDGDCRTEEQIDELESTRHSLKQHQAAILQFTVKQAAAQVAEKYPNAMRMLAEN